MCGIIGVIGSVEERKFKNAELIDSKELGLKIELVIKNESAEYLDGYFILKELMIFFWEQTLSHITHLR